MAACLSQGPRIKVTHLQSNTAPATLIHSLCDSFRGSFRFQLAHLAELAQQTTGTTGDGAAHHAHLAREGAFFLSGLALEMWNT